MNSFVPSYLTGLAALAVFAISVGVFYLLNRVITPMRKKWHSLNFGRRLLLVVGQIIIIVLMAFISLFMFISVSGIGNTINVLLRGS